MGIVVPILRTLYVSLNVYDTFKTLKLPPPSARHGGQPSVRALSQRKRAMKGCLSVWIIWCCFAAYERTLDGIIGIFIPFYSEIKSLVILFFLLTRARGAEPIYLHVLRPLVKPYAPMLDLLVDVIQQFGDLLLVIFAFPIHIVSSFYHRFIARDSGKAVPESPAEEPPRKATTTSEHGATRSRRRVLENAQVKAGQQIWNPPASAYDDSPPNAVKGLPTPPAEDQIPLSKEHDEWRQYEAFPSAYPATPLHKTSTLYSGMPTHLSSLDDISEDPMDGTPRQQQGFHRSLLSPRESPNPDSDGDLSDDLHAVHGVHTDNDYSDEEDYEEEDDFDVTMSTPYPLNRIQNFSNMTTSSDTQSNFSARLSTVDGDDSSLCTRTNSEASTQADTDSSAADKRRMRTPARVTITRSALRPRSPPQDNVRANKPPRARPLARPAGPSRKTSVEDPLASDTENKEENVPKRRVVGVTPLKAPARRVPARSNTTGREPAGRPPASGQPRAPAVRPVARTAKSAPSGRTTKVVN